ncbi:MAG TPA: NTPase [Rhizobiales bacterium]|nr:NTPase [Hyphomicrobiales bacterium]
MNTFDDQPILQPEEDRFGFNPFAKAIADTIYNLSKPEGSVISINGAWGTGKSSIVNLVKHHLNNVSSESNLKIIDFNCWWFRGEEALAMEFFRELYAAMDIAQSEKAKDAVSGLGSRLLTGSSAFVGAAVNFFAAPGAGGVAAGGMNLLGDLIRQEKSVESFHRDIAEELEKSDKRFLIVIDDIDRLAPDEALLIFRLVKSIGRLPNIMYLMAYDRTIAERVVSERYPSEGPQYLEKIVQAGFDIPNPPHSNLLKGLTEFLNELWSDLEDPDIRHFWNLFNDIVAPEIQSPRDVNRVINTLCVSWKAVAGEVDPVDFLCIETLRVQKPELYSALRANKDRLTNGGLERSYGVHRDSVIQEYDELFLGMLPDRKKERIKSALKRIFPALESIWGNMHYSSDFFRTWEEKRRVCSKKHFDTYFRFSLGEENISLREVNTIIEKCDDAEFIKNTLLQAKTIKKADGSTHVALLLDEINVHAKRVPIEKAANFLSALFAVHDEIDIEVDRARGFAFSSNNLRIHWILRSLLWERTSVPERSEIILNAAESASVGWLVDLWHSAYRNYYPDDDKQPQSEERCLTTEKDVAKLQKLALEKLDFSSEDGSLINCGSLISTLYRWDELAETGTHDKAAKWFKDQMDDNDNVIRLAEIFVSSSWSHGSGDTISVKSDYVSRESLANFFDPDEFHKRVEMLDRDAELNPEKQSILKRFLEAWKNDRER